jgi:hypothetical protein
MGFAERFAETRSREQNAANIKRYVWRAGHPNSFGQQDLAKSVVAAAQ